MKMNKHFNKLKIVFISALIALTSCGGDDNTPSPVADFGYNINAVNTLKVSFVNKSKNGKTYMWDFGDSAGTSTEENPSYTYAESGTYTVSLTVTSDGTSDKKTKQVTVKGDPAQLIVNGGLDDDSAWTIISHNTSGNGVLTIANGVATWDEAIDVPNDSWGNEAHMGMYQKVDVVGGDYQLDLDVSINGFDEVWFEVWVGTTEPVAGSDYNTPAVRVLSANAWDCKETQGTYSGSLAANSCEGTNGRITLPAGSYYIDIRSGGFNFGEGGITADNISMVRVTN
ncbi:MAG TPA: PKD domain-containing protein [Cyclobacteriaceae bacterium]